MLLPQLPGRAPLLIGLRWLEWNTFCEIQDVTKELRTLSLWTSLVEPNVSTHQDCLESRCRLELWLHQSSPKEVM